MRLAVCEDVKSGRAIVGMRGIRQEGVLISQIEV